MSKIKKITLFSLLLTFVLSLTGCMKLDSTVKINSSGGATVVSTMSIDKEAYIEAMKESMASLGTEMTDAELAELDSSMKTQGFKLVVIDGKEYYQTSETEKYSNKKFLKYLNSDGSTGYATKDTFYWKTVIAAEDELGDYADTLQSSGEDISSVMTYTMKITFDKKIVSVSGGKVDSKDSNTAIFDIPLDKSTTIFATTNKKVTKTSVKSTIKSLNSISKTKISSLKPNKVKASAKKATATLKFKKVKDATSYEIQYSTNKKFKSAKTETTKKTTYTLSSLKKNTTYYVRVRAVKKNLAGETVYSSWVKKTVKTKK